MSNDALPQEVITTAVVTEPLKPVAQTSYSKLFYVSLFVGPFLVFALIWLAENYLSPKYAEAFLGPLLAVWGTIVGGSGIATVIGGLLRTAGKIDFQKNAALDTIYKSNTEKVNAAAKVPNTKEFIDGLDDEALQHLASRLTEKPGVRRHDDLAKAAAPAIPGPVDPPRGTGRDVA